MTADARAELLARWGLTEATLSREVRSYRTRQQHRDRARRVRQAADEARWALAVDRWRSRGRA